MTNRCPVVSLHLLEPDNGKRCGELKLIKLRKHFIVPADSRECFKASQPVGQSLVRGPVLNASPSSQLLICEAQGARHGHVFMCCWIISDIWLCGLKLNRTQCLEGTTECLVIFWDTILTMHLCTWEYSICVKLRRVTCWHLITSNEPWHIQGRTPVRPT